MALSGQLLGSKSIKHFSVNTEGTDYFIATCTVGLIFVKTHGQIRKKTGFSLLAIHSTVV